MTPQEKAQAAQILLDDPIFKEAVNKLRGSYLQELLVTQPGELTAQAAHAKLLALEDVVQQLNSIITDEKMRQRRTRTYTHG